MAPFVLHVIWRNDMRKLVLYSFLSLDGGFRHGGWAVPLFDEQMVQYMIGLTVRAGALLLGRKTYDIFASSWPLASDEDPVAPILNSLPKYVVSRTLTDLEWNKSTLLTGDIAEEVAKLKQQPGNQIQIPGSGQLVQTLLQHDLIDEYHLMIFPALVGSGKRLFAGGTVPRGLTLVNTSTSSTGVMINAYERHGDLAYGEMLPE